MKGFLSTKSGNRLVNSYHWEWFSQMPAVLHVTKGYPWIVLYVHRATTKTPYVMCFAADSASLPPHRQPASSWSGRASCVCKYKVINSPGDHLGTSKQGQRCQLILGRSVTTKAAIQRESVTLKQTCSSSCFFFIRAVACLVGKPRPSRSLDKSMVVSLYFVWLLWLPLSTSYRLRDP